MSVTNIKDSDLIKSAIRNARPRKFTSSPRWAAVMDVFALGSTYSVELCQLHGFDPHEKVQGIQCPECEIDEN